MKRRLRAVGWILEQSSTVKDVLWTWLTQTPAARQISCTHRRLGLMTNRQVEKPLHQSALLLRRWTNIVSCRSRRESTCRKSWNRHKREQIHTQRQTTHTQHRQTTVGLQRNSTHLYPCTTPHSLKPSQFTETQCKHKDSTPSRSVSHSHM